MRFIITSITLIAFATTVFAHKGATGVVKVRMDAMSEVGRATKVLGEMAKSGTIDADTAAVAADTLISRAESIPTLFEMRDMTPPSESLAIIWEDWDGFLLQAKAMEAAARNIQAAGADAAAFDVAFKELGAACSECHKTYRQPQ